MMKSIKRRIRSRLRKLLKKLPFLKIKIIILKVNSNWLHIRFRKWKYLIRKLRGCRPKRISSL